MEHNSSAHDGPDSGAASGAPGGADPSPKPSAPMPAFRRPDANRPWVTGSLVAGALAYSLVTAPGVRSLVWHDLPSGVGQTVRMIAHTTSLSTGQVRGALRRLLHRGYIERHRGEPYQAKDGRTRYRGIDLAQGRGTGYTLAVRGAQLVDHSVQNGLLPTGWDYGAKALGILRPAWRAEVARSAVATEAYLTRKAKEAKARRERPETVDEKMARLNRMRGGQYISDDQQ